MARQLFALLAILLASACTTYGGGTSIYGPGLGLDGGDTTLDGTPGGDAAAGDTAAGDAGSDVSGPDAAAHDVAQDAVQDAAQDAAGPGPALVVDPQCVDGKYQESLPDPKAAIAGAVQAYAYADRVAFILAVLGARYPVGKHVLEGGLGTKLGGGKNCIDAFLSPQAGSTAKGVLKQLSTLVHECGHFHDLGKGGFASAAYVITDQVQFTCQGASHAGTNQSFARSLLLQDDFAAKRPPCPQTGSHGCDHYAKVYLDGDPKDGQFQGGDQGYSSVLEETVQYVNSLATDFAFQDQIAGSVSARDGILTFLWYLTRYLRLARLEHPQVYAYITGNACWREATLTVWGRAWLFLDATQGNKKLSLDGAELLELVTEPALIDEIARLRAAHGCPG